jgi:hypothetical protein
MSNTSLKKIFAAALLANGLFNALPARAEYIAQEEAAEAGAITVHIGKGKHSGTVSVTDCTVCPLELEMDATTRFYFKEKEVHGDQIVTHSGKPGTVLYSKDKTRAFRIRW